MNHSFKPNMSWFWIKEKVIKKCEVPNGNYQDDPLNMVRWKEKFLSKQNHLNRYPLSQMISL